MNNIYLVKANYSSTVYMYDYYDSCIIIAESFDQVEEIIDKKTNIKTSYYDNGARTILKVGVSYLEPQELLSSYNAG